VPVLQEDVSREQYSDLQEAQSLLSLHAISKVAWMQQQVRNNETADIIQIIALWFDPV